jgi:hypothetical protein
VSSEWPCGSELHEAINLGVKQALVVVATHYEINLERVCEGYVLPDECDLTEAKMQMLIDAVNGPGSALEFHFEDEVVPLVSSPSVGSYSAVGPPDGSKGDLPPPSAP